MSVIKGLIIKDLLNIKSYKATLFMIVLVLGLLGLLYNDMDIASFVPIFITLIFSTIAMSSFSYDNIAKADKYILSFPICKKDMVRARYIYVFLFIVTGAMIGFILSLIFQVVKIGRIADVNNMALSTLGAILGIMLLQGFQIPITYKFGAEKARIIQMGTVVILTALLAGIVFMTMQIFPYFFPNIVEVFKNYGMIILIIVIGLLYTLSYKISCNIYQKKEI